MNASDEWRSTPDGSASQRKRPRFTSEQAREAAKASHAARRAKKREREQAADDGAKTFRQRVGVALSKLNQADLDRAIKTLAQSGKAADLRALGALADQAFGRPG